MDGEGKVAVWDSLGRGLCLLDGMVRRDMEKGKEVRAMRGLDH
jgi:hypothetical protein